MPRCLPDRYCRSIPGNICNDISNHNPSPENVRTLLEYSCWRPRETPKVLVLLPVNLNVGDCGLRFNRRSRPLAKLSLE